MSDVTRCDTKGCDATTQLRSPAGGWLRVQRANPFGGGWEDTADVCGYPHLVEWAAAHVACAELPVAP